MDQEIEHVIKIRQSYRPMKTEEGRLTERHRKQRRADLNRYHLFSIVLIQIYIQVIMY